MANQPRAIGFALITLLMWSTVATAFKLTLAYASVLQTLAIASVVSSLVLLILVTLSGKGAVLAGVFFDNWRFTLLAGLLNPVIYYLILFEAYDRLPAQLAQPINLTWTIVLSLMAGFFLKQRIRGFDYAAALISYTGVLVIVSQGDLTRLLQADWIGVGLAIISTLIWAGYWTLNIRDQREPLIGMCLNFVIAAPVVLIVWWMVDGALPPLEGIAGGIYIGLFEMSLAFVCWSLALKSTDNAATISNLIFLSPFLSLQLIHFVLGEVIHWTTYAGLITIIVGIVFQQILHRRAESRR
ncbi:MAG: DMT family transporter [Gammaproteobacteria bacterium]|jgi:drug/metabolite transporter (DMT)-like permease|nr:DMT family transporter [Gammaproteobacteria bacterium]MBT5053959.1 DMT family transporter [Gammaproteobacteria bacterium]